MVMCAQCEFEPLKHAFSVCLHCGAMKWAQSRDPQIGFDGYRLLFTPDELKAARAGDLRAVAEKLILGSIPGPGWRPSTLREILALFGLEPRRWRAAFAQVDAKGADIVWMRDAFLKALDGD